MAIRVEIEKLVFGGLGLVRSREHGVILIPYSLPDETLDIEIIEKRRGTLWGEIRGIVKPSPQRTNPKCRHYMKCGGCNLQHTNKDYQKQLKIDILKDLLNRSLKQDIEITPMIQGDIWNYRKKVCFRAKRDGKRLIFGLLGRSSHKIIDLSACPLLDNKLNEVTEVIRQRLKGLDIGYGSIRVIVRADDDKASYYSPDIDALKGKETLFKTSIKHSGIGMRFEYGIRNFYQVNPIMARRMLQQISSFLYPFDRHRLIDLHSGVGFFSIGLAPFFDNVMGCDIDKDNVNRAGMNAVLNGLSNTGFVHSSDLNLLKEIDLRDSWLLLDPPREGLSKELINEIIARKPARIIYISCSPPEFMSDVKRLMQAGYRVPFISPVDFFPQTNHIEVWSPLFLT